VEEEISSTGTLIYKDMEGVSSQVEQSMTVNDRTPTQPNKGTLPPELVQDKPTVKSTALRPNRGLYFGPKAISTSKIYIRDIHPYNLISPFIFCLSSPFLPFP
jgi:hypothetical protein